MAAVTINCTKKDAMKVRAEGTSGEVVTWLLVTVQSNGMVDTVPCTNSGKTGNTLWAEWSSYPQAAHYRVVAVVPDRSTSQPVPFGTCTG
jgi:hypothetical protein